MTVFVRGFYTYLKTKVGVLAVLVITNRAPPGNQNSESNLSITSEVLTWLESLLAPALRWVYSIEVILVCFLSTFSAAKTYPLSHHQPSYSRLRAHHTCVNILRSVKTVLLWSSVTEKSLRRPVPAALIL